jgi:hypothetical protein
MGSVPEISSIVNICHKEWSSLHDGSFAENSFAQATALDLAWLVPADVSNEHAKLNTVGKLP